METQKSIKIKTLMERRFTSAVQQREGSVSVKMENLQA